MADDRTGSNRRDFLKLGLTAAPAAAAVAVTGGAASAETVAPDGKPQLAKTEHVKKYLETARF